MIRPFFFFIYIQYLAEYLTKKTGYTVFKKAEYQGNTGKQLGIFKTRNFRLKVKRS